ncbi:MAG: TRAP transporter substrate-binding protein [Rhodobacteraceae bacterium]|nr:TRAP transporter substrate-binding protein [Paracoccaceae bacterium]PHR53365.1 MAG: hypothetical protein COA47_16920 [Robiginitomaculum sp.]
MNSMISKFGTFAIASTFGVAMATTAIAADRTLSLGVGYLEDAVAAPGVQFWADRINELTNDELEVEIFWASQLGGARDTVQAVATGAVDAQLDVIELLVTFEPNIGALSLPLVFDDRAHFSRFIGSRVFGEMLDALESDGIIFPGREGLSDPQVATNWTRPFDRGVLANRPIFSPDDLEGVKMRMYESEIPIKSWEALGASIQVVPWPDVYTALATGVVDAMTGTISDNYEWKHFEHAPYWTNVHEYFQLSHPWMSKITWDSLTDSQRAAIDQATIETSYIFYQLLIDSDAWSRARAQEEFGLVVIEPPIGPWIERMEPALADFEARGLVEEGLVARMRAAE